MNPDLQLGDLRLTPHLSSLVLIVCLLAGAAPDSSCASGGLPATGISFERLGPFGGDARSLLIDRVNPNRVFLGTSNGQILRSTDGGATWKPTVPGINRRRLVIDTIIQHPSDPVRFYAGAWDLKSDGGGLFESVDGGLAWRHVPLPQKSVAVRSIAISPSHPKRILVGGQDGVSLSEDGGRKWTLVGRAGREFPRVESVAIDPRDPRTLYVGTWRLTYRSSDSGRTWVKAARGMLLDSHVFSIAVDARVPDVVYASACSGIYRSDNRARSWARLKILPKQPGVRGHVVALDPADPRRIYAGSTEGLFVSRNGGRDWTRLTDPKLTVHAVQIDPRDSRRILVAAEDRGVLISEDGGASWAPSNAGFSQLHIARILSHPAEEGRLMASVLSAGREGGIHLFDGRDGQWHPVSSEVAAQADILSMLKLPAPGSFLAGTTRGLFFRASSSSGWLRLAGRTEGLKIRDMAIDPEASWIFAGTEEGVYRSRTDALDFQKPDGRRFGPSISCLAISPHVRGLLYAGGSMGVLRSQDSGVTWTATSSGLPMRASVQCLAISTAAPQRLLAGTVAGLFASNDGGRSWSPAADGRLTVDIPAVLFLDGVGKRVLAADHSDGGLFFSDDGGESWERVESPGFNSPVGSLAQDTLARSLVYLGTDSEGVYRLRLPQFVLPPASR